MKLDDIKRHHHYPFADFVANDLSFLLLEMYWAELIGSILTKAGTETLALRWAPAVPADRLDGNPILQIIDRTVVPPRQVRIIQNFNIPKLPEFNLNTLVPLRFTGDVHLPFNPSLSYQALDQDGSTPMEEIVLFSDISDACERLNRQFIAKWCVERISVESMEHMLANYWNIIRTNLIDLNPL